MTLLSARISGTVRRMEVKDLEHVKAGQALVDIDDDEYHATLEQAKAALAASQASREDNQTAKRIQESRANVEKEVTVQVEIA